MSYLAPRFYPAGNCPILLTLSNLRSLQFLMSFQILACGSNGLYQLGVGDDEDHNILQPASGLEAVSGLCPLSFAFGGNHTLALYPDGQLYAAGDNEFGQCGVESPASLQKFTRVAGQWKLVAAGWQFSVLCSYENELYVCGYGGKGELGLGETRTLARKLEKMEVSLNEEVISIQCSINHTVLRLSSGRFLGWGVCRKGQLGGHGSIKTRTGKEKPIPCLWRPTILPFDDAMDFCLGRDRTILVRSKSISIHGVEPQEICVETSKVCAMWSSIHFVKKGHKDDHEQELNKSQANHTIHSVGNNLHGQCFTYPLPNPILDFTVGSEHGLVLLSDNRVFAWGWGEHGNCGAMRNENVTFDYLNEIYNGKNQVVMIAAGLATSWVVVKMPV